MMRAILAAALILVGITGCALIQPATAPSPTASSVTAPPTPVGTVIAPASQSTATPSQPAATVSPVAANSPTAATSSENIRLTAPSPNDRVGRDFVLQGEARVFEANVVVRVLDATGAELLLRPITASIAAPEWGTFNTRLQLPATAQAGAIRLELFWPSPRDGSRQDLIAIPLQLQP